MNRSSLFLFAVVAGCGGSTTTGTPDAAPDSDSATTLDSSPAASSAARPAARPSTVGSGGTTMWFAVSRLQLGLTTRSTGMASTFAWQDYGYDLDSRVTTAEMSKTSEFSCKRVSGSPTGVLTDSESGRDNSFGRHAMSVIRSLKSDAEGSVNSVIANGKATLLLKLSNVGGPDNANVPGELYLAAMRDSCGAGWAIDESSIDDSGAARMRFPSGYMTGGTWVSADFGKESVVLPLPWAGSQRLVLNSGIVTLEVTKPGGAGMIAGGTPPSELLAAIHPLLAAWGICPGIATYDQISSTLQQSVDLFVGGPYMQDTTQTCNAVSVGLGFVAQPIAAPSCKTAGPSAPPSGCM
jgi:hypothetical protein